MILYSKLNIKNIVCNVSKQNRCVQGEEVTTAVQMERRYMGFCTCDYLAGFGERSGAG